MCFCIGIGQQTTTRGGGGASGGSSAGGGAAGGSRASGLRRGHRKLPDGDDNDSSKNVNAPGTSGTTKQQTKKTGEGKRNNYFIPPMTIFYNINLLSTTSKPSVKICK